MNRIEKLFDQIGHELGWHDHNMRRDRPYNGQPHTDTGTHRGATEIKGITFRDLRDCFIRAYIRSHSYFENDSLHKLQPNATLIEEAEKGEAAALSQSDVYRLVGSVDPIAVSQNLCCEIEKIMGIYPNVPKLYMKGTNG